MPTILDALGEQVSRTIRKHVVGLSADTIHTLARQAARDLPTPALEDVKRIIEEELAERSGRSLHA